MSFKVIKKKSTLETIVQQIKDQIKKGILKPGEKLPSERKLADLLGVSRASVREAIQALAFSGYLEVIQGKGTYFLGIATKYDEIVNFFSEFSHYSLDHIMEVRIMLEGETARLAALNASCEEIEVMEKIVHEISNPKKKNNFFVKDLEIHLVIAKATHNPLMNGLMKIVGEMIYGETEKILEASKGSRENDLITIKDLVQAIKGRNENKAKQLMVKHIKGVKLYLKNELQEKINAQKT